MEPARVVVLALLAAVVLANAARASWRGNLTPIAPDEWTAARAAHLLERATFGATPADVRTLAAMTPAEAVTRLVHFAGVPRRELPAFEHSGIFDEGLDPFPPSRPATTALAKTRGSALGVDVKPGGNRPVQPIVNRFFYWLRASRLETDRVAYWWANRMLTSPESLCASQSPHLGRSTDGPEGPGCRSTAQETV